MFYCASTQPALWFFFHYIPESIWTRLRCCQWEFWSGDKSAPPPPQRLNVALQNWNLSVFDQCSNITYLLMQVPCYLMLCSDKLLCTGLWHRGGSQLSTLLLVTHHAPSIFIDGVLHRQTIRYQAQCHQHYYKACLGYEPSSCKITG